MSSEPQETPLIGGPDAPQAGNPAPLEQIHRLLFKIRLAIVVSVVVIVVIAQVADTLLSFWACFGTGAMGSTFPIMNAAALNEKSRLVSYPAFKWELYSKVITGGVLAIFIYFLFMSGLLSGEGGTGFITSNLFPVFSFPKNSGLLVMRDLLDFRPATTADYGKLLVWSAIAGYSRTFVTGVFDSITRAP
jgi:hypothetical protein